MEQQGRERYIARVLAGEQEAVAQYFEESLQDIVWPRETDVDYDLHNDGTMFLNVDLPEIEEMPIKTASAPARGYRLTVKDMSATAVQKLCMRHIHAIGFRMIGEVFAVSPAVKTVILSAYSKRPSKTTGQVADEYLYSVRVARRPWENINFDNLVQLDVVDALARFDLRRNMTKTGLFKEIEPSLDLRT